MATDQLITTRELAAHMSITRQHVARLVRENKLVPVFTLANGAHLFTEEQAALAENTPGATS